MLHSLRSRIKLLIKTSGNKFLYKERINIFEYQSRRKVYLNLKFAAPPASIIDFSKSLRSDGLVVVIGDSVDASAFDTASTKGWGGGGGAGGGGADKLCFTGTLVDDVNISGGGGGGGGGGDDVVLVRAGADD
uniref:Uncharacterized protein n=1 Tax=Romanomermis culicivorax TaxID=13658 RepID=A0A915KAR9_ROMCU